LANWLRHPVHTATPHELDGRREAHPVAYRDEERLEAVHGGGAERGAPHAAGVPTEEGVRARRGAGAGVKEGAETVATESVHVVQALAWYRRTTTCHGKAGGCLGRAFRSSTKGHG